MESIDQLIDYELPGLVELRHQLHKHPELAYEETETARRVVEQLQNLPGMELQTGVAETGVVATLGADRDGPCVALRADMDALPIEEITSRPYRSKVPGKMHACGHDGHVTCLVGAARVLSQLADLAGPVRFVFQPAEEGGAGGRRMCEEGVLEDPEVVAIFALHGWPDLEQGQVGLRPGVLLASSDRLTIQVRGGGGHAAFPQHTVDPVLTASHIVVALQSLVSRNTDPLDSVVVTVAQIHGGTADNIIPGEVSLRGTVRTLSSETRNSTFERIRLVSAQTAAAYGAEADVVIDDGYPMLENDADATTYMDSIVGRCGFDAVPITPVMGGEDFAFYSQQIPASMVALGVRPAGQEFYPQLHQPDYEFPDEAIAAGVRLHVETARRFWSEGLGAR
ncbi:MAG: M20 family metallopeptidase [Candidatus Latescibacterota bacterium]|nr:M20 family metallopeptidase [Candidatus Latescibacterota bacterium]